MYQLNWDAMYKFEEYLTHVALSSAYEHDAVDTIGGSPNTFVVGAAPFRPMP